MFDSNNLQEIPKRSFYPNLTQSWILVLCLFPVLIFANALGEIMKAMSFDNSIMTFVEYVVALGMLTFIAFAVKSKIGDKPLIHYKGKVSAWVYVFAIPAIIGLSGLTDTLSTMILPEIPESLKKVLEENMSFNLFSILTAVVAAPVFEEIICRGIICEGLIKNISPRAGILWSAFIFALIHLNPWQGLSAFVIGCFIGWIYWKTRSIIPCIFIHFTNNALALCAYLYYSSNTDYDLNTSPSEIYSSNEVVIIIVHALIFFASFGLIVKILKSKRIT
ncbi:MAG: CPBP family intramembrane metalloprotease [Prevotellaceae bacterium]|jgi:membrane protease YdiL (CAAX protease family)|nr:CPBP family intramembrane metalloprotease [Prevotellaceae bacterium]